MKIVVTSVFVEDQDKAAKFYTEKLGFVKKQDFPVGEFKWLTVVSPEDRNGTELLLEPNDNGKRVSKGTRSTGHTRDKFWCC
jgi:catechol 2,3-dioxygenase-like lactoylglutathione lyase family enzyme